jgi:hypothetical protein
VLNIDSTTATSGLPSFSIWAKNVKTYPSRVEKYHNPLVAEGESLQCEKLPIKSGEISQSTGSRRRSFTMWKMTYQRVEKYHNPLVAGKSVFPITKTAKNIFKL